MGGGGGGGGQRVCCPPLKSLGGGGVAPLFLRLCDLKRSISAVVFAFLLIQPW